MLSTLLTAPPTLAPPPRWEAHTPAAGDPDAVTLAGSRPAEVALTKCCLALRRCRCSAGQQDSRTLGHRDVCHRAQVLRMSHSDVQTDCLEKHSLFFHLYSNMTLGRSPSQSVCAAEALSQQDRGALLNEYCDKSATFRLVGSCASESGRSV